MLSRTNIEHDAFNHRPHSTVRPHPNLMQPSSRIAFNYPIYALDLFPDGTIAIAGGGGQMKSGIPNKCTLISFLPESASLREQASIDLPDAVVAIAASGTTLHSIIGVGVKNFSCTGNTLIPQSSFRHDLRVSATEDQSAIAISQDLSTLVIASDEGHVVSLSLPRYEKLFSSQLHTQGVTDLTISRDGSLVASTSRDRSAYLWSPSTGQIGQILKPCMPPDMRTHIRAVRFSPSNPDIIFTVESNPRKGGWIAAWRRPSGINEGTFTPVASVKASVDAVTTCSVNNDGTLISASSSEGHVMLLQWDGSSFFLVWSTETKSDWFSAPKPPHDLPITGLRFSQCGEHFFSTSADYSVAAWPIKRPTNWRRMRRMAFWFMNLLILFVSMLVTEDHLLPGAFRYHRARVQPYLEPQLSKVQRSLKLFIRDRQAQIQPYISETQSLLEPHVRHAWKRIRPYTEKVQEHRTLQKSKQHGSFEQKTLDETFLSSQASSLAEKRDRDRSQEPSDDSDSSTEARLEQDTEGAPIPSQTHRDGKQVKDVQKTGLGHLDFGADTHRNRDHWHKPLHASSLGADLFESQCLLDISPWEMDNFEKLRDEEPISKLLEEQGRHKREATEKEFVSQGKKAGQISTGGDIVGRQEGLRSQRRKRPKSQAPQNIIFI